MSRLFTRRKTTLASRSGSRTPMPLFRWREGLDVPARVAPSGEPVPDAVDDFFGVVVGPRGSILAQQRLQGRFEGLP